MQPMEYSLIWARIVLLVRNVDLGVLMQANPPKVPAFTPMRLFTKLLWKSLLNKQRSGRARLATRLTMELNLVLWYGTPSFANVHRQISAFFPQISEAQRDKVWSYIESAKAEGATLAYGGKRWEGKGWYQAPTSKTEPDLIRCAPTVQLMTTPSFRRRYPGYEDCPGGGELLKEVTKLIH